MRGMVLVACSVVGVIVAASSATREARCGMRKGCGAACSAGGAGGQGMQWAPSSSLLSLHGTLLCSCCWCSAVLMGEPL